jgi:hypothetical protein
MQMIRQHAISQRAKGVTRARKFERASQAVNFLNQQTAFPVGEIYCEEECAASGKASAITGHAATLARAVVRVGTLRFAHPTSSVAMVLKLFNKNKYLHQFILMPASRTTLPQRSISVRM